LANKYGSAECLKPLTNTCLPKSTIEMNAHANRETITFFRYYRLICSKLLLINKKM